MAYVDNYKIAGQNSLTWNGTVYWPVSDWTVAASGCPKDSYLRAAVRFLMSADSAQGSVHIIAQYAAYTATANYVDTTSTYFLMRRLNSAWPDLVHAGAQTAGTFWSTLDSTQRQGYIYAMTLSDSNNNTSAATKNFYWLDSPYFVTDCGTVGNLVTVYSKDWYVGTTEPYGGAWKNYSTVKGSYNTPAAEYTVSYNANGGSGTVSSQTKVQGTALALQSSTFSKTGYHQTKWNTKADGTGQDYALGGSYTTDAAVTLYAVWAIDTYTIGYNANGGSGTVASQVKTYGVNLTLASSGFTRTGYTLSKWNTNAGGTGTNYNLGGTYSANAAATMYAVWTLNTYTVAYNNNGGSGTISSQTKSYGVNLTLSNGSGFSRSLYTLSKWNTSADGNGTSYALSDTYTANAGATLYAIWAPVAPTAPTSLTNTRNSDTKNTLTWTNPSAVITTTYVYRSTDGGSYSKIATISGSVSSYVDTSTSANHRYAYKVKVANSSGSATSSASSTTYNTPAAPSAVVAARQDASTVLITITNPALTATALDLQRSTDGVTWSTVSSPSGTPVTSTTDTPGGGTFYYRARNTRGTLVSAWKQAAEPVVTLCEPAAPTLLSPASGVVVSTSEASITFAWQHNPIDGSGQEAAHLQYSTDGGGTWTTVNINDASQTYSLANGFSANDVVTWRVATKGAYANYGPYSSTRTFNVYSPPTVVWTSPANGSTITNMPISVSISYSDTAPSALAALSISVTDSNGVVRYSLNMGTSTTATITADDWLPNDLETYDFTATARSTSSLQATDVSTCDIQFVLPDYAYGTVTNDEDSGTAQIQVAVDTGSGGANAESVSVYRIRDGVVQLVASGLADGDTCIDWYAPLNVPYEYQVASFSAAGAAATTTVANTLVTNRWHVRWGTGDADVSAIWEPAGSINVRRPTRTQVQYAGRIYPVSYDGVAMSDNRLISWQIETLDERDGFLDMMAAGGRGVYKSCDGDVFMADFDLTFTPAFTRDNLYGMAQLTVTRIESTVV